MYTVHWIHKIIFCMRWKGTGRAKGGGLPPISTLLASLLDSYPAPAPFCATSGLWCRALLVSLSPASSYCVCTVPVQLSCLGRAGFSCFSLVALCFFAFHTRCDASCLLRLVYLAFHQSPFITHQSLLITRHSSLIPFPRPLSPTPFPDPFSPTPFPDPFSP